MRYIQVFTTTDSRQLATKICNMLVEKRLAACAQVFGPITSTYWWKGKRTVSKEYLCLIKTKSTLYKKVEKEIKKNHTYMVPEIIAVPILAGNKEYLKWLETQTE